MTIICSAPDVEFTPTVGGFHVAVSGGARLLRKNSGSSVFAVAKEAELLGEGVAVAWDCNNFVAGTVYKFERSTPGAVVEAAQ